MRDRFVTGDRENGMRFFKISRLLNVKHKLRNECRRPKSKFN